MPITDDTLRACIRQAGFPSAKREYAFKAIVAGLESFRQHRVRRYYSSDSGELTDKKPPSHHAKLGRHSQREARFVLISAMYRAWWRAFDLAPTLNHKNDYDSAFARFAMEVMAQEGIGCAHWHLEEYWSFASKTVRNHESAAEE